MYLLGQFGIKTVGLQKCVGLGLIQSVCWEGEWITKRMSQFLYSPRAEQINKNLMKMCNTNTQTSEVSKTKEQRAFICK